MAGNALRPFSADRRGDCSQREQRKINVRGSVMSVRRCRPAALASNWNIKVRGDAPPLCHQPLFAHRATFQPVWKYENSINTLFTGKYSYLDKSLSIIVIKVWLYFFKILIIMWLVSNVKVMRNWFTIEACTRKSIVSRQNN